MQKLKLHSPDLTQANIDKLDAISKLFPHCVTEALDAQGVLSKSVDFDQLRQELSATLVEGPQERYQLNWPGKREALLTANAPIAKTLRPCREESVDFDTTQNLFIEGDNLDALKLLQETYLNKVKMIYIDPPYNTGSDFIYEDDFAEDSASYFERSNQIDSSGNRMVANTDSNGRFHSDWLTMMYSRLRLARNLLKGDGVIFISIDDGEVGNLKLLCDEVFGSENFINQISIKAKPSSGASGGGEDIKLKKNVEYLLCYCKSKIEFARFNDVFDERSLLGYIKEYKDEGKSWKYTRVLTSLGDRTFHSEIKDGGGQPIKIFKHVNVEIQTLTDLAKKEKLTEEAVHVKYFDRIFRDTNAQSSIRQRVLDATDTEDSFYSIEYVPVSGRNKNKVTSLYYKGRNKDLIAWLSDVASLENGKLVKKDKVGTLWQGFNWNNVSKEGDIQYPNGKKPIAFIQRMLSLCTDSESNELILDFFAGSGSVAHAVIAQNHEDGGARRCISIQIDELISKSDKKEFYSDAGYKHLETICDITKERIRRAGKKIREDGSITALGLDIGFRVLKIDSSNMKEVYYTPDAVSQDLLSDQVNNIREDRTAEDLLFQVLLDWGVDLSLPITQETIDGKPVFFVDGNALAACFETGINEDFVKLLAKRAPLRVVFRDAGFASDSVKINVEQIFKLMSPGTEVKTI
jgi:adenine-specific DNA-methyltransferase